MTEHEAIGYLLNRYLVVGSPANPPKEECEMHNAVLDMAIQAIAKQIAEKPLKGGLYSCPNCEKLLPMVHLNQKRIIASIADRNLIGISKLPAN